MAANGGVKVWLGTRKGAYLAESDGRRRKWKVRPVGPDTGPEAFHVVADPRRPSTVYAALNDGWWGPQLMRSRDSGKHWLEVSVPGTPRMAKRKPPIGAPSAKFPIKNLWHIEPGPADRPRTIYLGVDPASLWRSDDEGESWRPVKGINEHATRKSWNPGAGGMCLHTVMLDPTDPDRMYVGISAAGLFRSDDGGRHWSPKNKGVLAPYLPNQRPEVGQCVHKLTLDAANPRTIYRQDHGGIYVSHNRGDSFTRIGRTLESDFGFVVGTSASTPGVAYFVPMGPARLILGGQFQVYRWSEDDRRFTTLIPRGKFVGGYGMHREGIAIDRRDPAGIYVGTTTGQLFASPDDGKSWSIVPYQFPGIHSVSVSG